MAYPIWVGGQTLVGDTNDVPALRGKSRISSQVTLSLAAATVVGSSVEFDAELEFGIGNVEEVPLTGSDHAELAPWSRQARMLEDLL